MILYGGLDSLLVASIAARHFAGTKSTKLCEAQLQSFCVGLDGSPDLKAGKEVADYLEVLTKSFTSLFRSLAIRKGSCLLLWPLKLRKLSSGLYPFHFVMCSSILLLRSKLIAPWTGSEVKVLVKFMVGEEDANGSNFLVMQDAEEN
ncbi:uncharacterized protein LOC108209760 isoform X2 [Daucus carota subsp. sativus]|uniref:uncharacterized protein LOC108209760 isoform X2 n=1 Tax=Daucus carota subsp. sativus TaxID=79200 RepID=UPI0007EEFC79|nr:PREDICTED: uncharacterized protein LOC108209760 isoform X2 [Daucus carota subsp. sativus]